MKTQKCISILSVTLTGLLLGSSQALAAPLLDSDSANFTALGASSVSSAPKNSRKVADSHSDSVQAIAAINASVGSADPATGNQRGVGATVSELARALNSAERTNSADESTEGPIQSSSPTITTAFAAFPSALVVDEFAAVVPEPATMALLALGLAGIGYSRKQSGYLGKAGAGAR